MEKEGFGEEFSICSSSCFGGIRGGQIVILLIFTFNTYSLSSVLVLFWSP